MTAKCEQETIIRFDAESDIAHVYTAAPAIQRKMARAKCKPTRVTTRDGVETGWFYEVPVSELRWKIGRKRVSDAARKAASERFRKALQQKNAGTMVVAGSDVPGSHGD